MRATLSIIGLYNYDHSIMDGLTVPEGLEKSVLVDYILMECADLELLYPDWTLMERLITSWASAREHSWEKLYQSTQQQFNMIHNYDRYEEWTDTDTRTTSGQSSSTDSTQSQSSGTTTTSKAAYNTSEGLTTTEQVSSTALASSSGTGSNTSSGTESGRGGHEGHTYGNIGVTTASQMLEGVRDLYKWDVYQAIAQEFKQRFCVMVY